MDDTMFLQLLVIGLTLLLGFLSLKIPMLIFISWGLSFTILMPAVAAAGPVMQWLMILSMFTVGMLSFADFGRLRNT